MKELSIEEKAARYDKAIEKLRSLHDNYDTVSTLIDIKEELEQIFHELKESEDDRIRKEIIKFIKVSKPEWENYGDYSSWIAWLEKQGEPFTKKDVDDAYLKGVCDAKSELEKQSEQNPIVIIPKFRVGDTIHEIGENTIFPMVIEEIKDGEYVCENNHSFINIKFQDDYELVEQKPSDKVEPKFKVGDWVTDGVSKCQIRFIDDTQYWYSENCILGSIESIDKRHHLWAIQDAKDGDVLYSLDSKQPFIYKERPQFSQAIGYCCINKFGGFAIWNTSKCVICTDKYIPATKEQRDLLFQKMKEAGYEWDAEKKELTKIKQISAWSEEDERLFQIVIDILDRENHKGNISHTDLIACVRKLKSLKKRHTWKPSKEQMCYLSWIANVKLGDGVVEQEVSKHLNGLYDDLKKLMEK